MTNKSRNKRRYVRVEPEQNKPVKVDVNGRNFVEVLCAHDISEGGLSLSVSHGFNGCSINEPVELVVRLPEPVSSSFSSVGKIKHIDAQRFGVVFLSMTPQGKSMTRRYVNYRLNAGSWWGRLQFWKKIS